MKKEQTTTLRLSRFFLSMALPLFVFALMITSPGNAFAAVGLEADGSTPATAYVTSTTDINMTGNNDTGIYAHDGGTASLDANVTVSGSNTWGALASGSSNIHISGDVSADGNGSHGIFAGNNSSVNISGDISASGDRSIAAEVWDGSIMYISGDVSVSGDINASGVHSIGAAARQNSYMYISGDVKADGKGSHGIVADSNSSADLYGSVSASGYGAIAAMTTDNSSLYISGDVKADGEDSGGVVAGNNSSAYVSGDVRVTGNNSLGLYSTGNSNIFIKDRSVEVNGSGSTALQVETNGSIHLDNASVSGDAFSLLRTTSGGNINAVNGSNLSGDVNNLNNSSVGEELNINLSGSSNLTGSINDSGTSAVTNLTLNGSGDSWFVTDNSLMNGSFTNNGKLDYSPAALGTAVTVGDLDGNGTLAMKTDIVSLTGDKLIVTGTTSGSHIIDIANNGGAAATGNERLTLVETADQNGSFALTNDLELGAWIFSLGQSTSGTSALWQLYASGASNPGSDAVSTFAGAYMLGHTETQTLIQRLGDLRTTPRNSGLWFRAHGGKIESDARNYIKNFDMDYGGVQLGYDRKMDIGWDGEAYAGIMFGYSKGDLDYVSNGGGDVDSKMLGLYATFIKPNGFYLDAILKYQWMDNEFDSYDSSGAHVTANDVSTGGFGFSVEVGQRISFNGKPRDGWYAEPQVQLSYQRYDEGYFNASNGLRIGVDGFTSILGRLGALVGYESEKSNFYAKVFEVKEFDGDATIRANGVPIPERFDGSWWVYGLGFTSRINDRNSIYMDIERAEGGRFEQPWAVKAGWRIEF